MKKKEDKKKKRKNNECGEIYGVDVRLLCVLTYKFVKLD